MTFEQAQMAAGGICGPGTRLETRNGVRLVISADGRQLGAGPGWLSAMRMAAKPILAKRQEIEKTKEEADKKRAQTEYEEFKAWKAAKKAEMAMAMQSKLPLQSSSGSSK